MTQKCVVGNAGTQRGLENIDVVDSLPAVRTFAEQILVHVGNRERVRVDATRAGEDALKDRPLATRRQRGRDSRLKHPVTLDHATATRVEPRTVERVSHLADQPFGGSARQAGIGIEGDHVADPGRHDQGWSAIFATKVVSVAPRSKRFNS